MRKVNSIIFLLALTLSLIAFTGVAPGQNNAITSLAVTPGPVCLLPNSTQHLTATATISGGSNADVTNTVAWSTSDTAVATVSSTGLVNGVSAGQAVITATVGSVSGSSTVSVVYSCPANDATDVPIDIAVDVVFNQNIDNSNSALSQITMSDNGNAIDPSGNPFPIPSIGNCHAINNALWILDPWNVDGWLPPNDQITVDIPAGCLTFQDGGQNTDISFTFTTAKYDVAEYTTYSAQPPDHYLFNFTTPPVQAPLPPTTVALTVYKHVYDASDGTKAPDDASKFTLEVKSSDGTVDVSKPGSEDGAAYNGLPEGRYTVTESGPAGYTADFSQGGFDSRTTASGTIDLAGDASVSVGNTYQHSVSPLPPTTGDLTVVKHVYGSTANASDFTLYVKNSDGTVVEQGRGSETGASYKLTAGRYTVSEAVYGNVYGSYTPSFSGFDSSDSVSGTVYLAADGARTVYVINTYSSGSGGGRNPSGGSNPPGSISPAPAPGANPNAAPPPGPSISPPPWPNAAPPPGPPKLPKTGVDPGGVSAPWPIPAGILALVLLSFVVVKRKRIFSSR